MKLDGEYFSWSRISWWHRSRLAAVFFVLAGLCLAIILVGLLGGGTAEENQRRLTPFALSGFPLLIVILVTVFARVCDRINIRAGGRAFDEDESKLDAS